MPNNTTQEIRAKASEARKNWNLKLAISLYESINEEERDSYDLSWLAYCYRKLKNYEEAHKIAVKAYKQFPNFEWCKNELIWSLIQWKIDNPNTNFKDLLFLSKKILEINPDDLAFSKIVFKVLKEAKKNKERWVMKEWIKLIEERKDIFKSNEEKNWDNKNLYLLYKCEILLEENKWDEVISLLKSEKYNSQNKKFFERLKGQAFLKSWKYNDAENSYKLLINDKSDWWIIQEYWELLIKTGKIDEGYKMLIKAVLLPPSKYEMKVTLIEKIWDILGSKWQSENQLMHYLFVKSIREKNKWNILSIDEKINKLNWTLPNGKIPNLLTMCKNLWFNETWETVKDNIQWPLIWIIKWLNNDKKYCFIFTETWESFFCSKNLIPKWHADKQTVKFEIEKSFDRIKRVDSYKVSKIF